MQPEGAVAQLRRDATDPPAPAPWSAAIPEARRRRIRLWLWSIAAMTFGVMVVGGITRLTLSGLSIVEWNPVMGVIPPLGEARWQEAFDAYRRFPEYQQLRQGMTLGEFKFIFFWEYLHRLLARTIGIVFLVPFLFFSIRGWFNRPLLRRALLLFGLGALQGVMGWLMVASGLVDRPSVSHYRLAAHLSLAFLIFGWAVWLIRELTPGAATPLTREARRFLLRGLGLVGALLGAQIIWGAFTAGLKAGRFYPTFPLMGGRLVPGELLYLDGLLENFVANPIAVQWVHRVLGTLLLLAAAAFCWLLLRRVPDPGVRRLGIGFTALLAAQYGLGVTTLLLVVPVTLGVLHQATALVLFGLWLAWLHRVLRGTAASPLTSPPSAPRPG